MTRIKRGVVANRKHKKFLKKQKVTMVHVVAFSELLSRQ